MNSPFTMRMRFLLKSIWAAIGQAWDKELSVQHSKLFNEWCSESRELRTISINRLYFKNSCSNLRLHIFTDGSEETICIVAYLQDQAKLRLTYVIGKCPAAPIRHMTIPNLEFKLHSTEFVSESRYSMNMISKLTKSIIGPIHQQCYSGYRQRTRNNKCSLRIEQRKYWKLINGSTERRQRCRKPCRHRNPRNGHRRTQGIRMFKRGGMSPGRWRKVAKAVVPSERTRTWASY